MERDEVRERAGVEMPVGVEDWAGVLPKDPAENVFVQDVGIGQHINWASPVINNSVQNAVNP